MKDPCVYLSRAGQKWAVSAAGQTSYGFANMCGSELCRARRAAGLPALAVGWGPIANVGVMAESDKVRARQLTIRQRFLLSACKSCGRIVCRGPAQQACHSATDP